MPQHVCFICLDKINDFYEFRLMALNTENQTRDALGLPAHVEEQKHVPEPPKPKLSLKESLLTKPAYVRLTDLKHSKDSYLIQRALQRLSQRDTDEDIPSTSSYKRESTPLSAPQPPAKKSRKDISCNICSDMCFSYINDLQDHQIKEHLPHIAKYACGSCRETFEQLSDFKSHENMHTVKKLPYICYICKAKHTRLKDFQKHMTNFTCPRKKKMPVKVQDIKCFQCKKKFITQNMFEWHGCFIKTRGSCTKCGLYVQKKKALLKHYVLCKAKFVTPEAAREPNLNSAVKHEQISPTRSGAIVNISNVSSKVKGVRKKTVPQRRQPLIKAEREVNLSHGQQQDEEDDEYANYEEDITYDNFGSDEDDQTMTNLEPVVELQEQAPKIIDIKAEGSGDFGAVREVTIEPEKTTQIDPQIIRNVKRETASQQNVSVLNIKPEQERSVVNVLNPVMAMTERKKVFKLPQQLAMKIKKEKLHSDYGDNMRDEAEPDPEEEALMQSQSLVKLEKVDSENAVKVTSVKPSKQFINPIALAMMRAKNASVSNDSEPTTNGSNSLIISAVTSIGEIVTSNGEHSAPTTNEQQSENTHEKSVDENTQHCSNATLASNPVMIEIPPEFSKSADEQCYYSPEAANKQLSPVVAPVEEKNNDSVAAATAVEELTTLNNLSEAQAIKPNEDDELDQLLQNYDCGDANDLADADLTDLLKFD